MEIRRNLVLKAGILVVSVSSTLGLVGVVSHAARPPAAAGATFSPQDRTARTGALPVPHARTRAS